MKSLDTLYITGTSKVAERMRDTLDGLNVNSSAVCVLSSVAGFRTKIVMITENAAYVLAQNPKNVRDEYLDRLQCRLVPNGLIMYI